MSNDDPSRSQRLDEITADYLAAKRAGKNPDRQEILRRHEELAELLRAFFADQDRMVPGVAQGREEATIPPRPSTRPEPKEDATIPPGAPMNSAAPMPSAARKKEPSVSLSRRKRAAPPPGTKVSYFGDYELIDEIARGGMGVVYKARQVNLNRIVALKMILSGQLASDDDVKRFYTEAEAAATLDHPGIVPIYEVGQYEGQHYFSMGFIQGQSLDAKVARGPLRPVEAAGFAKKVCEAIAYAHSKGVIHRDLKPANILLDSDGEPKVTDFGLAKKAEAKEGLTTAGQILGTPGYMPPEQAAGKTDEIGPAADTYSLGAILYCLLTGRPPFQAATVMDTLLQVLEQEPVSPRLLNSEVPRDLETICLKCLRKQPARRYESAQAVAEDIGRWLNHEPILARPVTRLEKTWLWCRRKPAIAALLASLVVVTVAAAGIVYERQNATHAAGLVDALVRADVQQVPGVIDELNRYQHWSEPLLRQRLASAKENSVAQLHLRLALVGRDDRQVEVLYEPLLRADAAQLPVIRDALAQYETRIADRLWTVLDSRERDPQQRRLRAAAALARYDPENAKWSEAAPEVAGQLVQVAPVFVGQWREALRPAARRLLGPLAQIFADQETAGLARSLSALLIVDYAQDDPELLTKLVLDADARAFATLFPALQAHRTAAVAKLQEVLARKVESAWNDAPLESGWIEPSPETRARIEGAHGILTDRFALSQNLPWDEFLGVAEALRPSGYRPTRVRPYRGGGAESLVAAVWMRDGRPWELQTDLTKDQLPPPDAPAEKNGLVPADVSVIPSENNSADRRFVLLWLEPSSANEKRWLVVDVNAQQLADAKASFVKQETGSQSTINVWTDAAGQRHFAGIWSSLGAPSELESSCAGYERVEQPQWDVAVSPAAKPTDPLDALRQQLTQFANLPPDQKDQPPVRLARAQAQYHLGQLELALADLDFLAEQKAASPEVHQFRAWTLARLGRAEPARAELAKYIELQNDPTQRPYVQIVLLAWLGDRDDAASQLEAFAAAAGTNADALYNVVCAASLASQACGESDSARARQFANRALELLETAVANGYRNAPHLRADVDLASLHRDPRFTVLLEKLEPSGRYAAVWHADLEMESRLLTALPLEEMQNQGQQLVAEGYRPTGIAVDTGASWNSATAPASANENEGVLSSILWHRPIASAAEKERLALQQSIAAVALLRLVGNESTTNSSSTSTSVASPASVVWPLFEHQSDPRLRSYLLHRLASYGADPALLLARLKVEQEVSRRRVLILAIGEFVHANLLSPDQHSAATAALARCYADDPDPGIHSAAEWSLMQLGEESQIVGVRDKLATGHVEGDRQWFVTQEGQQTFVVLRPADEFLMGSPVTEAERHQGPTGKLEMRHRRRIGRTFAIATKEVTIEQFQKSWDDHEFDRTKAREENSPANFISWYDAARFCNWLSKQEGIPRDQWCYDPDQKISEGLVLYADYLQRTGYRLPTEAEWEYACRSGAATPRHFGETEQLLTHYAWYTKNSHDRWMLPVGSLKPNDAGLFDMHGNAAEWTQDVGFFYLKQPWMEDKEQAHKLNDSVIHMTRGGSFASNGAFVRAADRTATLPIMRFNFNGMRVARTVLSLVEK